jgi:hypothetical protein
VEKGEKLDQLQLLLFIGAMKNGNFACRSCSNCGSKHMSPFAKLVEGYVVYNFAICIGVHLVQGF